MILSDKTITDLCIRPDRYFDSELYECMVTFARCVAGRIFEHKTALMNKGRIDYDSILNDSFRPWTEDEIAAWKPMIEPFSPELIRSVARAESLASKAIETVAPGLGPAFGKIISRGLTSYGYDVQLADDFKVFTNIHSAAIDPKRLDPKCLVDVRAEIDPNTGEHYVLMPPNSYLLGRTVEYFRIPRDIMVICVGKSTYARSGAIVNVTPIEPGFEGNVVIEISNSTNLPARVYAWEGIAQFMFFRGDRPCNTSYGDRGGKYQGQTGLTLPRA